MHFRLNRAEPKYQLGAHLECHRRVTSPAECPSLRCRRAESQSLFDSIRQPVRCHIGRRSAVMTRLLHFISFAAHFHRCVFHCRDRALLVRMHFARVAAKRGLGIGAEGLRRRAFSVCGKFRCERKHVRAK
eukprot:4326040-Pleurochrysis_carterae.AAC.1